MKANKQMGMEEESNIDLVSAGSGFDGFVGFEGYGQEIADTLVSGINTTSPIDVVNNSELDYTVLDQIATEEDYMGLQDYIDTLDDEQKIQAREYLINNYPEFFQDVGGDTFEPMKDKTSNSGGNQDVKKITERNVGNLFRDSDIPENYRYAA